MIRDQFLLDIAPEIIIENFAGGGASSRQRARHGQLVSARGTGAEGCCMTLFLFQTRGLENIKILLARKQSFFNHLHDERNPVIHFLLERELALSGPHCVERGPVDVEVFRHQVQLHGRNCTDFFLKFFEGSHKLPFGRWAQNLS